MSYSASQIQATINFIVQDAFDTQSAKSKQFITTILTKRINALIKTDPRLDKIAINPQKPGLFIEFFEWLTQSEITFPENTIYTLNISGQSFASHKGQITMLHHKFKQSLRNDKSRKDIIDAFEDFSLSEEAGLIGQEDEYESDEYEGDEYETDEYEGDECEGDEYEGDEYEGDEYEGDECEGDEFEGDEYEEDVKKDLFEDDKSDGNNVKDFSEEDDETPDLFDLRKNESNFERVNRSKSKRGLFYQANVAFEREKEQRKQLKTAEPPKEQAAVRFDNPLEGTHCPKTRAKKFR